MDPPPQLLFGKFCEPSLNQIEPAGGSGRKVQVVTRSFGQPVSNQRRFVGSVVIQNQVYVEVGGDVGFDGVEKVAEFF